MGIFFYKDYEIITLFIIQFISLMSNIIALISLFRVKHKDIFVILRIYLCVIDILAIVCIFVPEFNMEKREFIRDALFVFINYCHELWIIFMCYAMRQAICFDKIIKIIAINIAFLVTILFSVISLAVASLLYIYNDNLIILIIVYLITILISYVITFFLLCFYYLDIKRKIERDTKEDELLGKIQYMYYYRIYGYPLIFCILIVAGFLLLIQISYKSISRYIEFIRMILYGSYSFFDSIFYGMTKSSIKSLKNFIKKSLRYEGKQEIFYFLRNQRVIYPRYIYDIIGISEDNITRL